MPKNFDELLADDLSFVVRGETFRMDYVRPEVLAAWEDEDDDSDADAKEGDAAAQNAIARLDDRILGFLPDSEKERWTSLRAREESPVPFVQLRAIVRWMVEVQTERPTETPSPSGGGRGRTAASSTVRSPSQAAA
jgi:hypothetical protein